MADDTHAMVPDERHAYGTCFECDHAYRDEWARLRLMGATKPKPKPKPRRLGRPLDIRPWVLSEGDHDE